MAAAAIAAGWGSTPGSAALGTSSLPTLPTLLCHPHPSSPLAATRPQALLLQRDNFPLAACCSSAPPMRPAGCALPGPLAAHAACTQSTPPSPVLPPPLTRCGLGRQRTPRDSPAAAGSCWPASAEALLRRTTRGRPVGVTALDRRLRQCWAGGELMRTPSLSILGTEDPLKRR